MPNGRALEHIRLDGGGHERSREYGYRLLEKD